MHSENKIGVVGLAVLLVLVAVPLALAQPLPSGTEQGRAVEAVAGGPPVPSDPIGVAGPPATAILMAAGTVLLASGLLLGQILRLRPSEQPVNSR